MAIPGYADLQVNGYRVVDFSSPDLTVESFLRSVGALLESGTVLFQPTQITSPLELYRRNCGIIRQVAELREWQRNIPDVHLEDPFLSPEPRIIGRHNPNWMTSPAPVLLDWFGLIVRLITVAAPIFQAFARHAGEQRSKYGSGPLQKPHGTGAPSVSDCFADRFRQRQPRVLRPQGCRYPPRGQPPGEETARILSQQCD